MTAFMTQITAFCTEDGKKYDFLRMAFIVAIGIIAYSNTLGSPFSFDDSMNISNNPLIMNHSFSGIKESFLHRRAIGIISFQLNHLLFGFDITWYHITNILIHLLASLSVYRVLQLLTETPYVSDCADNGFRKLPLPFFAALLFVAHPVQTQAVTYIVQRFASLATLFYLATLFSYLKGRLCQTRDNRIIGACSTWWIALTALFAFLAFYTKETAYTLPIALIVVELLFFRSGRKKIVWLAVGSAASIAALFFKCGATVQSIEKAIEAIDNVTRVQTITSRTEYLFTQFRVIMTYIRLIFFPVNQRLEYDYELSHSFFEWRVFCSFIVLSLLFLAALWMLKRSRGAFPHLRFAAFGIIWFFLTLTIESSILPIIDLIFEHRLYLPIFGALTAISSLALLSWWGKGESSRGFLCTGVILVSLLLAALSFKRNFVWASEAALWADSAEKSPKSGRAWSNLGGAYIMQKEPINSLKASIRAIELDPSKPEAWNNLGVALDMLGAYNDRFYRTKENFTQPDEVKGSSVSRWLGDVNNNLGLAYEVTGNLQKAAENYKNAAGYNPSLTVAYYNLGIVSAKAGDAAKYSEQKQILMMLDPVLAERLQARVEKR